MTPGVEVCTGPLGQGISNAVGMAIAQAHLAATFNRPPAFPSVIDNYTFCISGDGCLQEGVASEAASIAGHLGLGRLIVLWDDNRIQIDGGTDLAFSEDVLKRMHNMGCTLFGFAIGLEIDHIFRIRGVWLAHVFRRERRQRHECDSCGSQCGQGCRGQAVHHQSSHDHWIRCETARNREGLTE